MPISSPNIRPPCGGPEELNKIWLAGCAGQNVNHNNKGVSILTNTTLVQNYNVDGPYTLPYKVGNPTGLGCSPFGCPDNVCYDCGDFGVTNHNVPCITDLNASWFKPCGSDTTVSLPSYAMGYNNPVTSTKLGQFFNCFSASHETKSLSQCSLQFGRKNVYASKAWIGLTPFLDPSNQKVSSVDYCGQCIYVPEYSTPGTTKYLGISANSVITLHSQTFEQIPTPAGQLCCPNPPFPDTCFNAFCYTYTPDPPRDVSANAVNARHIDKFGNQYLDSVSSGSTGDDESGTYANQAFNNLGNIEFAPSFLVNRYVSEFGFANFQVASGNWTLGIHSSVGGVVTTTFFGTYVNLDYCGNVTSQNSYMAESITLDLNNNTLDVYMWGTRQIPPACDSDGINFEVRQTIHQHWGASNTTFNWYLDSSGIGTLSFEQTQHEEVNGSFSSPYTATQVKQDCEELLSHYPLGDDIVLPWQLTYSGGPWMHYDETTNGTVIPVFPSSEPTNIVYTGNRIGDPAPRGVDKVWSPQHANWCICDKTGGGDLSLYLQDFGAWSTNIDINAPCATSWLDVFQQSQCPQGSFIKMNQDFTVPDAGNASTQIFDNVCWMSKYAQTIIPNKQSFNFARPCEADRFEPTSSGYAVTGFDTASGIISVDNVFGLTIDNINAGDYIWLCRSGSTDGCYRVGSVGLFDITVDKQIVSASSLPDIILENCGTGLVSKLRWQPPLMPAICGRISITDATNTSPVTCSLQDPSWLVNGDTVTIVNATGNTAINGNWTVTVQDNQNIILNGSTGNGLYKGGGQIYSQGYDKWAFNDVSSKNQFKHYNYAWDIRSVLEYQRMHNQYVALSTDTTCDQVTPCPNPLPPAEPRPIQQPSCSFNQAISSSSCTTVCIPGTHCGPVVAYCSPNVESFGSKSKNFGWYDDVLLDSDFGTLSQNIFKQSMDDLYFSPPPCPPEFDRDNLSFNCFGFNWESELQGSCENDFIDDFGIPHKLYAGASVFEGVCELPFNSSSMSYPPNLKTGTDCGYLGCLTIAQLNSATSCSNGNVCYPPDFSAPDLFAQGEICPPVNSTDLYHVWESDIVDWLNRYYCVCNNGRQDVIDRYEKNGFICNLITNTP